MLQRGLLPLSAFPDSPRFQQIQQWNPTFYQEIYARWAEPILRRPYRNSGIFLTPIDFRRLPDLRRATMARIAVPLDAITASHAALTYERDSEQQVILPLHHARCVSGATRCG